MERSEHGFLEELLQAPRRDSWTTFPVGANDFFSNGSWNFDSFEDTTASLASTTTTTTATKNSSFVGFSNTPATEPSLDYHFSDQTYPFVDASFTVVPEITNNDTSLFPSQEDYPSVIDDHEELGIFGFEERKSGCCKDDVDCQIEQAGNNVNQNFNMGLGAEQKSKTKKLEGQPSKNLMAERRRRKRLNDRLSMLRSIVPKISKMDRTSILGDTIDYMKELLERINKLQEEEESDQESINQMNLMANLLKEAKPNEGLVRNSPKFNVEKREMDARVDICCATKPGLLLSTVNTLETLGLEVQQCVISCFNDFSMQASCSEDVEQRTQVSPEDIKQALFRTAGYGGRCL